MILRKHYHLLYGVVLVLAIVSAQETDSKTYDDTDWIPIAPKHIAPPQPVVEINGGGPPVVEKKATGRVLNLAEPAANSFFPDEPKPQRNLNNANANNFQQYLRETTTYQKLPPAMLVQQPPPLPVRIKPAPLNHPYKFDNLPAAARPAPRPLPPKPQKEFYVQQQQQIPQQAPQQAQFIQYYQPHEYHTIPEEYLTQSLPQALPQQQQQGQQYFPANFDIPDLPPIRLNTTPSRLIEKRPKPIQQIELTTSRNEEKENVQLLYVPLESLQNVPKRPQSDLPRLHAYQQAPIADLPPQFINYRPLPHQKQQQIHNIQSDFAKQALDAHKLQLQLQQQQQPLPQDEYEIPITASTEPSSTTTTRKPTTKKRKAHQPPLAVYMGGASSADVSDVLSVLKDAKSIEVQDSVGPQSPSIFVGPSNLETPRGYVKFDLPYLSSLDTNRVERKVDQYPFFVAPLSYKAPAGYSKIPLPSPHVGSVVVSTKDKEAKPTPTPSPQPQLIQNIPDTYQEYTLQTQPQGIPTHYEYQSRPTALPSSTPRYSKPIPEQHVIAQHEIDEINSFIPQYGGIPETVHRFQEPPQRPREPEPERYKFEPFRPQHAPSPSRAPSSIRFGSTVQPQFSEAQFIDEILQQQTKPTASSIGNEEYARPSAIPTQNEGQYLQEVTRPVATASSEEVYSQEEDRYESVQQPIRTTTIRSRTTPPPPPSADYDQEEITRPPTRVRTRPTQSQTHVRESYEIPSRTTHLRSRPTTTTTTTTPEPTTQEPIDQYLKETILEARPKPRPTVSPTSEKPKYSIQEQFSITRATTPAPLQYTPIAQEYEEELKPHRPVIYKYKQSDDSADYQQPIYYQTTAQPPAGTHQLNQEALDAKVLSVPDNTGNYVSGPSGPQLYQYQAEEYDEPQHQQIKTQNANVENYNIASAQQAHGQLPNLINNLEDQSVRQLLQPGLIPTSPRTSDLERYEVSSNSPITTTQTPTSNYPSTHLPIIETTTQRKSVTRGRVRGNRFSSSTTESSASSTRRAPVTRGRRPLPSRTRYSEDEQPVTEGSYTRSTTDPTKKIVTSRSRFRTRGRPAVAETTDRVSSSNSYDQVDVTPAHIQSSHVPSVQIIEPQVTQRVSQEYINYRPLYNVPVDDSEPVVISGSKKVTKPGTEPVVIHQINQLPIKNLEEENTENTASKLRPRGRRPSTTASPPTDAPSRVQESEESPEGDYYGFFREPNFRKTSEPTPTIAAETPRAVYSSTYVSSTLKPHLRQDYVDTHSSTENVRFVGEIRPKYQTTAQYGDQPIISTERFFHATEKEAEEEKPKVRSRVRLPTRTRLTADAEDKSKAGDESRTVAPRTRTRGKTHYRVPMKPKRPHDSNEDEDVEGGNYPAQFKAYQTTPRPSFQITVDPHEDQEGFQSIYRPTYVAKDISKNEEAGGRWVENYQMPNYIGSGDIKGAADSDVPIALPSIATAPEVNHVLQAEQQKVGKHDDSVEKIVEEMMQEYEDEHDTNTELSIAVVNNDEGFESTTTLSPLPETTTHKRRRGVWKLVRRPVDVFEGAESQNAAGAQNMFETDEKPVSTVEITTTPAVVTDAADVTTQNSLPSSSTTSGGGFFDSLYDMFGISGDHPKLEEIKEESELTTTARSVVPETTEPIDVETLPPATTTSTSTTTTTTTPRPDMTTPLTAMTYITPMSLETWNKGILKTSTSTEISHETEICYKGKCVKSKDMKVPMT